MSDLLLIGITLLALAIAGVVIAVESELLVVSQKHPSSEQPKRPSHTIRLTVWMLIGLLAGYALSAGPGNALDPWFTWKPLIYSVSGAFAGLAVELFRRFLEAPAHTESR